MAKTLLFDSWTWNFKLPEPFDIFSKNDRKSETIYSIYCKVPTKKSTLHGPALQAILEYMDMDTSLTPSSASKSAVGSQGENTVVEYHSRTNEIHAVYFNKKNGKFTAARYQDPNSTPQTYSLKASGQTGSALFFALMTEALKDQEFYTNYEALGICKNDGYRHLDEAKKHALILCDNLYRRIENADVLGNAGIKLTIPNSGNIQNMTPLNLRNNMYSPSSVLFGKFQVLTGKANSGPAIITSKSSFVGQYPLSTRTFTPKEELMIPKLEDWYVIPPEVVSICKHAHQTTNSAQPMRNFMMRGEAGTGKTEGAKAIAAGLGIPYLYYTCSANTEIYELLGQMLPETSDKKSSPKEYPTLMDIQMDPSSAYYKLTGIYEDISDSEVYDKLLEVIEQDIRTMATDKSTGQKFRYVETPLITAIRNGYLIEVQEPTVIANPGVLVGLNALLDRCASITLITGEVVHRHPDTVVVITTNNNYAGCRDLNQSVISRMNLIMDIDAPDSNVLAERAMKITGCSDFPLVTEMAKAVQEISGHCKETMINDGSCGVRELISWVQSYMVCGNVLEAAKYTILSSASADPENRADILSTCLENKFSA